MARYKGFSTVGRYKKFRVTDVALVKQDLLNHFAIRRGEKLMNPEFGSIIWNCLYEPITDEIRGIIIDDVTKIVNYDPRTQVVDITIDQYDTGLQLEIDIEYVTTSQQERLVLSFDRDSGLSAQS
jgi:phage baseplate assembly protein W